MKSYDTNYLVSINVKKQLSVLKGLDSSKGKMKFADVK